MIAEEYDRLLLTVNDPNSNIRCVRLHGTYNGTYNGAPAHSTLSRGTCVKPFPPEFIKTARIDFDSHGWRESMIGLGG